MRPSKPAVFLLLLFLTPTYRIVRADDRAGDRGKDVPCDKGYRSMPLKTYYTCRAGEEPRSGGSCYTIKWICIAEPRR